jgi:hypothetical protein
MLRLIRRCAVLTGTLLAVPGIAGVLAAPQAAAVAWSGDAVRPGTVQPGLVRSGTVRPAADPTQTSYSLGVLVLKFFPTADGTNIDSSVTGDVSGPIATYRAKTDSITSNLSSALSRGSTYRGYANSPGTPSLTYHVVNSIEHDNAVPTVANPAYNPPSNPYAVRPDYPAVMNSANICNYVNNEGVSEVWMYAYQGPSQLQPDESKMSGPNGDVSNEWFHDALPVCTRTYTLYTFNYGRGTPEALESHDHQFEYEMRSVDNQEYSDSAHLFNDLFEGPNYPQTLGVTGRCGSVHNPPNARHEYDRANTIPNASDCLNWNPDGLGTTTQISCTTWELNNPACSDVSDSNTSALNYDVWWMQNIPGAGNAISYQGKPFRNWWDVHGEWDAVVSGNLGLTLPVTLSCKVSYSPSSWTGGFNANVTISNTGSNAINGWTLAFTFPGDQKITSFWNATVTQTGESVTAVNTSSNATIPAGGSTSFGFQGTWTSSNASPASFTLNGSAC